MSPIKSQVLCYMHRDTYA